MWGLLFTFFKNNVKNYSKFIGNKQFFIEKNLKSGIDYNRADNMIVQKYQPDFI